MPLPAGAHVKIGDKHYRLDESADAPYRRYARSIYADIPVVGSVGQSLQPGRLVWNQTNFDGEGQVVLDPSDQSSARRFYISSGLDLRTAGQFQLNKTAQLTLPTPTGSTSTTVEAAASMTDVSGTSTSGPTAAGATTWTASTSGTTTQINDVAWSADQTLFVAVGNSGLILTSPDGSTWTSRSSGKTWNLNGVAYAPSLGVWLVVGNSGVLRSTNGSTWTDVTPSWSGWFKFQSVTWSASEAQFVITDGYGGLSGLGSFAYSTDGTNIYAATATEAGYVYKAARNESGDLWVAPEDGTSGVHKVHTSTDGRTWTASASAVFTYAPYDIAYSATENQYVVVGNGGMIATSSNGTSWTSRTSGTTNYLNGVTRSDADDLWVAVGYGGIILSSADGSTWTSRTSGTTADLGAVTYASTLNCFLAVGASGTILKSTPSLSAATDRQLNATTNVIKTTSNHTPGAYSVTVDFYAYRSPVINVAGQANPTITLTVYNATDSSTVTMKTATLSSTSSSLVSTISFTAAASKAYSYRVTWTSGTGYKPIVDKIVYSVPASSGVYTHEAIQLGQGGNVWVAASSTTSSTNTTTYTYDFSTDAWTNRVTASSTANKKPLAMAHTDKYGYLLLDDSIVYQATTSAISAYIAATTATARGIAITQNRLFVLGEDATNGVVVYLYGIDQTSLPVAATTSVTVDNAKNTPDATYRQRMTSSPNGALFFVNYSTRGVVYECDASDASPVVTILAELPEGVKATAILHTGGLTFVAAQFLAPSTKTPRSALFMIDQNGVIQRIGWFRREDPNANPVIAMQAYQNDLWMLQGGLVWRYSLTSGGLYLEHDLNPTTPSAARGIAVTQDYVFAAYDAGVYVVGKLATYQSSASLTSSVYDFGLPYEQKLLRSIDVATQQLPANTQVLVEYQLDQNGVWITAGTSSTGSLHTFLLSDAIAATRFYTLQTRVTPLSTSGTSTPVVRGITAQAYTTTTEELFEIAVLTTDQDSETPLAGEDLNGSDLASYVWELHDSGALVTLLDGYSVGPYEEPTEYLCKIEAVDHVNVSTGEGSVRLRLRVVT